MLSLNNKSSFKNILGILFSISLLLAACGGSPTPAPTVGEGEGEAPAPPILAPSLGSGDAGLCSSDYFPVAVGATWTYSGTGLTGDFIWTSTITEVSESSFTITNQFDELVTTQQWSCTAEGLAALQYGGGPEATIAGTGIAGTFETTDTSGVSFPVHLAAGDAWEQSFTIHGDMELADGLTASTDGLVTQSFVAMGVEPVTVPAGTFDAMRIEATVTFDLTLNMSGGLTVPMEFASTTTNWWVQGLGWVKSDSSATIEDGEPFDSITELQSVSIP